MFIPVFLFFFASFFATIVGKESVSQSFVGGHPESMSRCKLSLNEFSYLLRQKETLVCQATYTRVSYNRTCIVTNFEAKSK